MFTKAVYDLRSLVPLLMHNGQTSNPLNPYSIRMKIISSKRGKTEKDFAELARLEKEAGLYIDNGKIVIPSYVVEACLKAGAKKNKLGKAADAGINCIGNPQLIFPDMDKSIETILDDEKYTFSFPVRIKGSKVMRTRPIFQQWGLRIELEYDSSIINKADLDLIVERAGDVGLGDWRPKYGRFTAEKITTK